MLEIYPLFPTAVSRFKTEVAPYVDFINSQERVANTGNHNTANSYLLEAPELAGLKEFCLDSAQRYFREINKAPLDVDLYITQSWANYTKPGEYHHEHKHPNSFLSGVVYINAEKDKDRITFFKDNPPQIAIHPTEFNEFNCRSWWVPIEAGTLLIFPSHLIHMVELVEAEGERVSIAFNTFLKGRLGDKSALTELLL